MRRAYPVSAPNAVLKRPEPTPAGTLRLTDRPLLRGGLLPIMPLMSLPELLMEILGRVFGFWWLDNEVQRADLTAADFLVRFSVGAGAVVFLIWIFVRF
jgi:hypothetical protein